MRFRLLLLQVDQRRRRFCSGKHTRQVDDTINLSPGTLELITISREMTKMPQPEEQDLPQQQQTITLNFALLAITLLLPVIYNYL